MPTGTPKWPGDHEEKHRAAAKLGWARRKRKAAAAPATRKAPEKKPISAATAAWFDHRRESLEKYGYMDFQTANGIAGRQEKARRANERRKKQEEKSPQERYQTYWKGQAAKYKKQMKEARSLGERQQAFTSYNNALQKLRVKG